MSRIEGDWLGLLRVAGTTLRIVFHFKKQQAAAYPGTMDSPDQSAFGIPVDTLVVTDTRVTFGVSVAQGEYTGSLSVDSQRMDGRWKQGGLDIPLVLERMLKPILPPKRPQTPRGPFPYTQTPVTFPSQHKGVRLSGTLCMPKGRGPFPGTVLVNGSGQQDQDAAMLSHKPFLVIADQLARAGIATLRYNDRGLGRSTGVFADATSADFADDAEGGVKFLRAHPRIIHNKVGITGHSEGVLIAPMVAARMPEVAFLVLLAAPGLVGKEVLQQQSDAIMLASKVPPADRELSQGLQSLLLTALMENITTDAQHFDKPHFLAQLMPRVATYITAKKLDEKNREALLKQVSEQAEQLVSPWFRYFLTYDPAPTLQKVTIPVLALYGTKDLQVLAAENSKAVQQALRRGNNGRVRVQILNNLNHLFQHAETGSPAEYGQISETFAPEALQAIIRFVKAVLH